MRFKIGLMVGLVSIFMFLGSGPGMVMAGSASMQKNHHQDKAEPLNLTVVLERMYLDGEISEEIVHEKCWKMENFWAKYDQWQLTDMNESTLVFRRQVDDISPLLKNNGYFGVTNEGVFSIFNGRPGQSRIIQSFFQIDIKKLESKKQEELIQGIPIKTKDHYVQVLETFKQYSKSD
jgi:forespore regulator of the sigma-K checkpoint